MLISSTQRLAAFGAIVAGAMAPTALGAGRVIMTEIMYNPNSKEDKGQTEWIEIANVGDEAVEIKDWRIDDEDKWDWGKFSCTLEPGGVAVLYNADYLTEEAFREAWDSNDSEQSGTYQAIGVKWGGIANTPGPDNEIVQLLDSKGAVICEVRQEGQWPECNRPDGSSIYLVDLSASDLSDPKLWKKSDKGVAGGRTNTKTEIFGGEDHGSPGFVPGLEGGPVAAAPSGNKPKAKPDAKKPPAKPAAKPAASQPTSKPDNKIDY